MPIPDADGVVGAEARRRCGRPWATTNAAAAGAGGAAVAALRRGGRGCAVDGRRAGRRACRGAVDVEVRRRRAGAASAGATARARADAPPARAQRRRSRAAARAAAAAPRAAGPGSRDAVPVRELLLIDAVLPGDLVKSLAGLHDVHGRAGFAPADGHAKLVLVQRQRAASSTEPDHRHNAQSAGAICRRGAATCGGSRGARSRFRAFDERHEAHWQQLLALELVAVARDAQQHLLGRARRSGSRAARLRRAARRARAERSPARPRRECLETALGCASHASRRRAAG